jgi:hypothetical protein
LTSRRRAGDRQIAVHTLCGSLRVGGDEKHGNRALSRSATGFHWSCCCRSLIMLFQKMPMREQSPKDACFAVALCRPTGYASSPRQEVERNDWKVAPPVHILAIGDLRILQVQIQKRVNLWCPRSSTQPEPPLPQRTSRGHGWRSMPVSFRWAHRKFKQMRRRTKGGRDSLPSGSVSDPFGALKIDW